MSESELPIVARLETAVPRLLLSATGVDKDVRCEVDDAVKKAVAIITELVEGCGPLVLYHATSGHEGDGSDASCDRAAAAIRAAKASDHT